MIGGDELLVICQLVHQDRSTERYGISNTLPQRSAQAFPPLFRILSSMKNRADDNPICGVFIEDHTGETTNDRSAITLTDLLIQIPECLDSADAVFCLREKSVAQSNSTFFIPATNFREVFDADPVHGIASRGWATVERSRKYDPTGPERPVSGRAVAA